MYKETKHGTIQIMTGQDFYDVDRPEIVEANPGKYFYWFCLPGCMPDSDLFGPFNDVEEIVEDAEGDYLDDFDPNYDDINDPPCASAP